MVLRRWLPGLATVLVCSCGGVSVDHGMSVVNGVVDDLAIWRRALVHEELDYLATHAVP